MHILHVDDFASFLLGVPVDEEIFLILLISITSLMCLSPCLTLSTMTDALEMNAGGRICTSMVLRVLVELIGVEGGQLILMLSLLTSSELVVMVSKQVLMKI